MLDRWMYQINRIISTQKSVILYITSPNTVLLTIGIISSVYTRRPYSPTLILMKENSNMVHSKIDWNKGNILNRNITPKITKFVTLLHHLDLKRLKHRGVTGLGMTFCDILNFDLNVGFL